MPVIQNKVKFKDKHPKAAKILSVVADILFRVVIFFLGFLCAVGVMYGKQYNQGYNQGRSVFAPASDIANYQSFSKFEVFLPSDSGLYFGTVDLTVPRAYDVNRYFGQFINPTGSPLIRENMVEVNLPVGEFLFCAPLGLKESSISSPVCAHSYSDYLFLDSTIFPVETLSDYGSIVVDNYSGFGIPNDKYFMRFYDFAKHSDFKLDINSSLLSSNNVSVLWKNGFYPIYNCYRVLLYVQIDGWYLDFDVTTLPISSYMALLKDYKIMLLATPYEYFDSGQSYNSGYSAGFNAGRQEGYQSGYEAGFSAGNTKISIDWLLGFSNSFLAMPIFDGLTIGNFLMIGIMLACFGGLLKLFFGG